MRPGFSDCRDKAAYRGERALIRRPGKDGAARVAIQDMRLLDARLAETGRDVYT